MRRAPVGSETETPGYLTLIWLVRAALQFTRINRPLCQCQSVLHGTEDCLVYTDTLYFFPVIPVLFTVFLPALFPFGLYKDPFPSTLISVILLNLDHQLYFYVWVWVWVWVLFRV